jgi:hypothetical protein
MHASQFPLNYRCHFRAGLPPFDHFERARNRNFLDGVMALASREARFDGNEAAEFARWLRLYERHADSRLPAPDNEAMLAAAWTAVGTTNANRMIAFLIMGDVLLYAIAATA